QNPAAGRADGMAQRNGAAVHVNLGRVPIQELAHRRDWAAKASLASIRSISSSVMPAFASALRVEKTGPMPITFGSQPAEAVATMRAMGLTPSSCAFSALITTIAAAPSLMPEALAAVTVPSFLK